MNYPNNFTRIKVVAPSDVSTNSVLNTNLKTLLGLESPVIRQITPVLVAKTTSAFVGKTVDDRVFISGDVLTIVEGNTGFAAGDIFFIDLVQGDIDSLTATAAAST
jgi:hypothetical protein